MLRPLLTMLVIVSLAPVMVAQQTTATDKQLRKLLDQVWDFELTESPMLATNVGDPRGQDRLPNDSIEAIDRRAETRSQFLERLKAIPAQSLSELSRVDHELAKRRLEGQLADYRFKTHLQPISNRSGFHIQFPELPRLMSPRTVQDFQNYIDRLNDFPRYANDQTKLLQLGIDAGLTQPAIIMRDAVKQAAAHIVSDPTESLLYKNVIAEARRHLPADDFTELDKSIRAAITTSVVPTYRDFAKFLKQQYLPACRGPIGASALPQGREFYRDRVRYFTTIEITPEELHETGLNENSRIRGEMEAIRQSVNFAGDLDAFLTHLRSDKQYYAQTPDELLKAAALILKRADGRLPELFGRLPRIPYGLAEVPAYIAPQTTAAYYWPPSTDGKRGGMYYLNTYNLASRPLYQLEALSLHEAVPGHHLQLALQAELENLHPLSRESSMTAFIEGWALYSERLGKEIGFYKDPYQDFGRLSMEAWRASRLVVDTGIHWMGWTRQQAIDYMAANTALSEHNIVAEVDRYIGWPGQALAYKTGELVISRIRRKAEEQLGNKFDIRAFHDRVLEVGAIPLPLLEERIDAWITSQR